MHFLLKTLHGRIKIFVFFHLINGLMQKAKVNIFFYTGAKNEKIATFVPY